MNVKHKAGAPLFDINFLIFLLQSVTPFSLTFRQKRGCDYQIMAGESLHLLRWEHRYQLLVQIELDLLF
jgi:hypothetical protein